MTESMVTDQPAAWEQLLDDACARVRVGSSLEQRGTLTRLAGLVLEASGLRLPVGSQCYIRSPALDPVLALPQSRKLGGFLKAEEAAGKAAKEDGFGFRVAKHQARNPKNLPTPEELRDGKPNALGWWAPIENGAMFNGLYMDAAVNRWKRTKSEEDANKARKLMEGLLLLNSISEVKGFVGRGVTTDGKSHYPMGSNDQTLPWFVGLWRYFDSGLATDEEKRQIGRAHV